jgi:hypothetical protein
VQHTDKDTVRLSAISNAVTDQDARVEEREPPSIVRDTHVFCGSNTELEGPVGSSVFRDVVGDAVRSAAAVMARHSLSASTRQALAGTATPDVATSTLSAFVHEMAMQAPCFWARYTSLPSPLTVCTHDPKVDTVVSHMVHSFGAWFADDVWKSFHGILVNGSCPADRPVVLDLGLNIG